MFGRSFPLDSEPEVFINRPDDEFLVAETDSETVMSGKQ